MCSGQLSSVVFKSSIGFCLTIKLFEIFQFLKNVANFEPLLLALGPQRAIKSHRFWGFLAHEPWISVAKE